MWELPDMSINVGLATQTCGLFMQWKNAVWPWKGISSHGNSTGIRVKAGIDVCIVGHHYMHMYVLWWCKIFLEGNEKLGTVAWGEGDGEWGTGYIFFVFLWFLWILNCEFLLKTKNYFTWPPQHTCPKSHPSAHPWSLCWKSLDRVRSVSGFRCGPSTCLRVLRPWAALLQASMRSRSTRAPAALLGCPRSSVSPHVF